MYVYEYTHLYIHICIHTHTHIKHVLLHLQMRQNCVYRQRRLGAYVCVCACVYLCMYVCVCIYIYIYTCINTYIYIYIYIHTHPYISNTYYLTFKCAKTASIDKGVRGLPSLLRITAPGREDGLPGGPPDVKIAMPCKGRERSTHLMCVCVCVCVC